MLKNQYLIVFGEDYNRHPHALEHLVRQLIPYNQVLWVETVGLRLPRFTWHDFARSLAIISKWIMWGSGGRTSGKSDNLRIIAPLMLPCSENKFIRWINKRSILMSIRKQIKSEADILPIVITSIPNTADFVKGIRSKLSIYYCVDEFCLWPGLSKELIKSMEDELIKCSDVIFATSESLLQSGKFHKCPPHSISHGVDIDHFYKSSQQMPFGFRKHRICYYGLIDERCDQNLIKYLAKELPECQFTIIGEVTTDVSDLKSLANISFRGKVRYSKLPETIKDQDIFILPYHINELTNSINPLKIKEYLATGKPVVSSALPEALKLSPYVFVANNHEEFLNYIKNLMNEELKHDTRNCLNYLYNNESWHAKARDFSNVICANLREKFESVNNFFQ